MKNIFFNAEEKKNSKITESGNLFIGLVRKCEMSAAISGIS